MLSDNVAGSLVSDNLEIVMYIKRETCSCNTVFCSYILFGNIRACWINHALRSCTSFRQLHEQFSRMWFLELSL